MAPNQNVTLLVSAVMLLMVCSVVMAAINYKDVLGEEWAEYKLRYGKKYNSLSEDNYRFKLFLESRHKIAVHNQRHANGERSYRLGMNKFADMTQDEFVKKMNGYKAHLRNVTDETMIGSVEEHLRDPEVEVPREVDWRRHGAVTPVKDQGHCGSCWAFSSTGALEGQHYQKTGNLISLSEQNLVDCSGKFGNMGCNGGLMANAFKYIRENHGIDTENSYPYLARDDKCHFKPRSVGADDKGYVEIPSGDEKRLKLAIATKGPISVAIDASQESFRLYESGVYDEPLCQNGEDELDHGVLIVGYGTDPIHGDYYIVKNSWSELWGDAGYIKMARNKENQCGIATSAVYPLV